MIGIHLHSVRNMSENEKKKEETRRESGRKQTISLLSVFLLPYVVNDLLKCDAGAYFLSV